MYESEATRQINFPRLPRPQEGAMLSVSATQGALDLRSIKPQLEPDGKSPERNPGGVGHAVWIVCDVDLFVITGDTYASVTGANKPVAATVGSVDGNGAYTSAAGQAAYIPAKTMCRVRPAPGLDSFLGYVASGAGTMRVWRSSQ